MYYIERRQCGHSAKADLTNTKRHKHENNPLQGASEPNKNKLPQNRRLRTVTNIYSSSAFCLSLTYCSIYLGLPCGHLLGKSSPLGFSFVLFLF